MNIDNSKEEHCNYNNFRKARYFDGEILDQQIFIAEQTYHNQKRKLLNKMLHGWGVVCGLKVKATNPPSPKIIVESGLALDCHGSEILVCEEQTVDLSAKICMQKPQEDPCLEDTEERKDTALYVVIKYKEIESDPVHSYAPSGNCGEEKICDYSRTREGFCIEVWDKLPPTPRSDSTMYCDEPFKCPTCCPDPHYVVLATIKCGERVDRVFSECALIDQKNEPIKNENGMPIKIRYQIKRKLPKVCISGQDKISNIEDSYSFEADRDFKYDGTTWEIKANMDGRIIEAKIEPSEGPVSKVSYSFDPKGTKGSFQVEAPVILNFLEDKMAFANCSLKLSSPIYIGNTELKRGSIISDAMIRNMEDRQIVITYPLLSWLLSSGGMKELQMPSRNLVSWFCELMDKSISQEGEGTPSAVSVKGFEDVSSRLDNLSNEVDTRIIKKVETSAKTINKSIEELKKRLGDLEKKEPVK